MTTPAPAERLRDPSYYLVDFDFDGRQAVFARSRPEDFARTMTVGPGDFPRKNLELVSFRELLRGAGLPRARPVLRYFFHLPFSGSSLISRYLEPSAFMLRDPVSLFSLWLRDPDGKPFPAQISGLRATTLRLLARPGDPRGTLIRTAGSYPEMIAPLVRSPTFHSAVFLYSSPEHFLAQVLKSPERRKNGRLVFARSKAAWARARCGQGPDTLTDAQVALLTWLYTVEAAVSVARTTGKRIRTIDCADLFADRQATANRMCAALGLVSVPLTPAQRQAIESTHAKTGKAFGRAKHERALETAFRGHDAEIASGIELYERLDPKRKIMRALARLAAPDPRAGRSARHS